MSFIGRVGLFNIAISKCLYSLITNMNFLINMKTKLLAICLLLVTSQVYAEELFDWTLISTDSEDINGMDIKIALERTNQKII